MFGVTLYKITISRKCSLSLRYTSEMKTKEEKLTTCNLLQYPAVRSSVFFFFLFLRFHSVLCEEVGHRHSLQEFLLMVPSTMSVGWHNLTQFYRSGLGCSKQG